MHDDNTELQQLNLFGELTREETLQLLERQTEWKATDASLLNAYKRIALTDRTVEQRRYIYIRSTEVRDTIQSLPSVLNKPECQFILDAIQIHVRNHGWSIDRHGAYATVDIPVSALPHDVHAFIVKRVQERVLYELANARGFLTTDLVIIDLFIVLYEAQSEAKVSRQSGLELHTDGCLLSFNILLNHESDFEGGGTFIQKCQTVFQNKQGCALLHDAKLKHAGVPITQGRRLLLVGFVDTQGAGAQLKTQKRSSGRLERIADSNE